MLFFKKCKKVRFRTQKDAEQHISRKEIQNPKRSRPAGTYYCDPCKSWHTTSKNIKDDIDYLLKRIEVIEKDNTFLRERNMNLERDHLGKRTEERSIRKELMQEGLQKQLSNEIKKLKERNKILEKNNEELIIKMHTKANDNLSQK